jgi:hypothetical protein
MHLDDERIERVAHDELDAIAGADARAHLATCDRCATRLADATREDDDVTALLQQLDHARPQVDADAIARRARATRGSGMRRAAGIVSALGAAGALYAAPGSPVREWLTALRTDSEPATVTTPSSVPEPGGVIVSPDDAVLIVFSARPAPGHVLVNVVDGGAVEIRAPVASGVTFTSEPDRVRVDNRDSSATFEIRVPRTARRIEIRALQDRLFVLQDERVTVDAPDVIVVSGSRAR